MNKKVWSLLTIMMVAVMSFGFASCSSDDDEEEQLSSYYLDFDVTDKGNLSNVELRSLENAIYNVIDGEDEFEDVKLSSVVNMVNAKIKNSANDLCEAFPGKTFTVTFSIEDIKQDNKVVKTIELKCVDGQIK